MQWQDKAYIEKPHWHSKASTSNSSIQGIEHIDSYYNNSYVFNQLRSR